MHLAVAYMYYYWCKYIKTVFMSSCFLSLQQTYIQRHNEILNAHTGKCTNPPQVLHAVHNGPPGQKVFPLRTQLEYTCDPGYTIDGFYKAMCVGEGRWVGPRMTCSRELRYQLVKLTLYCY